ncbi:nicotinate-nucleotide adenylyltransferase [Microbulbifer thermotolerans]|uniref:Probable nicotinate-nucleotide adenylyltransferase n=2 Tax=Microbulbifer thermotolerans TaxID=252514 RepID=A0A143HJS1_MICTH|nr:nicotinate-nucleotide adenylyltransferase [Microbulbifer thermotolerans]AMX01903.1 nicotinic acid mononucleotide adenylyltransferase [Microbulbifer thermotolerans]MCX2781704.1 nicotinate-nucleotide adenylyltransferase [Microbulbifer thermotolerans]MCX2801554.1 nicotinate-nucleotide adenylyltransferase [Microbulbifer thermotolerans]WKT61436.1 nicotinate-nucleotide adenylyltransferase [Microbulbifer thermotolerans]SFB66894.1 nicotinate-nucleotide adenylyltransferase [Microbulbifer thermotoler
MMNSNRRAIALFGGTFDPVHFGHLRMALELRQALGFDEMRLLPSHQPGHRNRPGVSAVHRRNMLGLALEGCAELQLDERELKRSGPTYTVDTLEELRGELGEEASISFCMGLDSLLTLPSWHRWDRLLQLAHLVVVIRPGWQLPSDGEVADILRRHSGEIRDLHTESRGRLVVREQTLLPISATNIRQLIASGQSPRYLLPAAVLQYIDDHQLYRQAALRGDSNDD